MQKILIPTDFSPIADNALNYAIEIATKFNSELHLHHVYTMREADYDLNYSDDEQPFIKNLEQRMNFTKRKFIDKITRNGLSIKTMIEKDHIYALFKTKVIENKIDLIVMGSKGATGLETVIFGSTAAAALDLAKVPILVVPPKFTFQPLKEITLAIDLSKDYSRVLSPLQKLASQFGAKVTILYINKGKRNLDRKNINLSIKDVETSYREIPMTTSINKSIRLFIENNHCDLLCMIRRKRGFLESLFKGSVTKQQVYNSSLPLLVLPEN